MTKQDSSDNKVASFSTFGVFVAIFYAPATATKKTKKSEKKKRKQRTKKKNNTKRQLAAASNRHATFQRVVVFHGDSRGTFTLLSSLYYLPKLCGTSRAVQVRR